MGAHLHMTPRRRRTLVLAGFALALSLIAVEVAGGASSVRMARAASPSSPTPSNEGALVLAADDAKSVAGDAYYASAVVDDAANQVDLYLANAPQSLIDRLDALHPGTYVVHNTAPATLSNLLQLQKSLPVDALRSQGIDITRVGPTADGHLLVGVGNDDLAAAESALAPFVGSGILEVIHQAPVIQDGYRYNDTPNWNGGDFIYWQPSGGAVPVDCSSGINVKDSSHTYMLTAAHCYSVGNPIHNGYIEFDNRTLYGNGTLIGSVTDRDFSTDYNNPGTDTALITAPTGYDVFKNAWNSSEITAISGESNNGLGQHVCASGAFDGEACFLSIQSINQELQVCVGNFAQNCQWVAPLALAWNPNSSSLVATGQGDSGGPVYYVDSSTGSYTARGMVDGGQSNVSCTSTPPNTSGRQCQHELWFVQMGTIDARLGVSPIHN